MTQPTRHEYPVGARVLVEGVVTNWEWGRPYGVVMVHFREATDPTHMLDGVEIVVPQVLVSLVGVDVPEDYLAQEGYYEEGSDG